ncbi:MAG: ribonuclease HI [Candidatus Paceibacterota bacterium]|jgi:ribonuclease HI
MTETIKIYTDGAARGNPGPAGWGVVFLRENKVFFELGGRSDHATNNQMELTAAIEALRHLQKITKDITREATSDSLVEIYADSKYVILGITEWVFNWQKNNWRNATKKPVMNRELWEELFELTQEFKLKWHYVAGHSGHKWNDRVDEIATTFADNEPVELKK